MAGVTWPNKRENQTMPARVALFKKAPARPELERLLEASRQTRITDEELLEQRISFAYGNAPEGSKITKDSARKAANRIRVTQD
jgi:hypothetical protein